MTLFGQSLGYIYHAAAAKFISLQGKYQRFVNIFLEVLQNKDALCPPYQLFQRFLNTTLFFTGIEIALFFSCHFELFE